MRINLLAVGLGALVLACGALAVEGETESWTFDESTSGEDILWTSPTAVDNTFPRYRFAYEVTLFEVTVRYLIFTFTIDQTKQIPPELRSGSAIVDGPLPIVLFQDRLVFPPPPEEPGFAADVDLRVDGDGFGRFSMTDVFLGEIEVEIPGFGLQTVTLLGIRVAGTVDVTPLGVASDINCDGVVDTADLLILLAAWGTCPDPPKACPADVNGDGFVDTSDLLQLLAEWG